MDDHGLVWVDITSDFDPITYAEAFADEEQAGLIRESASVEDSLRALYEWGYLSKRDGRIQFLLPEDELDEASVYARAMEVGKKKGTEVGYLPLAKSSMLSRGAARVRGAGKYLKGMDKKKAAKYSAGAGMAVGSAMAARALYKKMRDKKGKKESLDDADLDELLDFAEDLGFEFENWDDLDEALEVGEQVDAILTDAEDEGLIETYSEEDIVEAALEEMSLPRKALKYMTGRTGMGSKMPRHAAGITKSAVYKHTIGSIQKGRRNLKSAAQLARGGTGAQAAAKVAKSKAMGQIAKGAGKAALGAGAVVGAGLAARALYRKMKSRKQSKSEGLDSADLELLVQDSLDLGFEFDSYDALLEAIRKGEFIDKYLEDAEANGLTETTDEATLVAAALEELGEASIYSRAMEVGKKKGTKVGYLPLAKYSHVRAAAGRLKSLSKGKKAALGVGGALAAAAAYRKMKKRKKKNESIEFSGYRSSAEGGIYESAPIPFGTGNNLHAANLVKKVWNNLDR